MNNFPWTLSRRGAGTLVVTLLALLAGFSACGQRVPEKTADPTEVEQLRQQHEDMSQREMSNEG